MNRLRIAMVSEHASPLAVLGGVDAGGQNVYVAHTARLLAAEGHQVDVFTRRDRFDLPPVVRMAPGVRVVHLDAGPRREVAKEDLLPHMPAFARGLRAWCDVAGGYDLLHAHFFMSAAAAATVSQALGIPLVVTFHALGKVRRLHQGDADRFPEERLAMEERVVGVADRIVAECPQDWRDLVALYGATPERLAIVPCGFDPAEMSSLPRTEARGRLNLGSDELVLLQLGRMVPRKGVDVAIEAVDRLRRSHGIEARLLIVGGSRADPSPHQQPELAPLARLAAERGVDDRVTFIGRRDRSELRTYYSAADVFISTPWYEPFGITPVEAMACGTPVIGSAVGGIAFSIEDGSTGYLVPPRDPDAVAARIAYLWRRPAVRAQMSRAAIRRANARFTWAGVAGALERIYRAVVAERAAAVPRGHWTAGLSRTPSAGADADGRNR